MPYLLLTHIYIFIHSNNTRVIIIIIIVIILLTKIFAENLLIFKIYYISVKRRNFFMNIYFDMCAKFRISCNLKFFVKDDEPSEVVTIYVFSLIIYTRYIYHYYYYSRKYFLKIYH